MVLSCTCRMIVHGDWCKPAQTGTCFLCHFMSSQRRMLSIQARSSYMLDILPMARKYCTITIEIVGMYCRHVHATFCKIGILNTLRSVAISWHVIRTRMLYMIIRRAHGGNPQCTHPCMESTGRYLNLCNVVV